MKPGAPCYDEAFRSFNANQLRKFFKLKAFGLGSATGDVITLQKPVRMNETTGSLLRRTVQIIECKSVTQIFHADCYVTTAIDQQPMNYLMKRILDE